MVKIIAHIQLYKNGRRTPFENGYKPLFNFINEVKKSGRIELIDRMQFYPGEEGNVVIIFLNADYLGHDFNVGKRFLFSEGSFALGEGVVKEIL